MYWPYSKELMFIGCISTGVLYTIRFIYKKSKNTLDYIKLILVLLWLFRYFVQSFHLYKIPFLLEICIIILFLWWFAEEGFFYFKNKKFKKKGIFKYVYYLTCWLTALTLFFGILFKIQHWPYGSLMFTLGVLLLCVVLLLDYFKVE